MARQWTARKAKAYLGCMECQASIKHGDVYYYRNQGPFFAEQICAKCYAALSKGKAVDA